MSHGGETSVNPLVSDMDITTLVRRLAQAPSLCLLLLAPALWILPPVPIDETRYLSIAWEMRQSASWITLHLNGAPYIDKPPLLFWLVNLSWSIFGTSTWSARLITLLFGAASIHLCGRIERSLSPGSAGQASWLLLGTMFFALFTGVVMFDVMLCFFVLLAFLALVDWVQHGGRRALAWLFFASSMGMLAKGPVMLLHLAGPILLSSWWSRPQRTSPRESVALPVIIAVAGALPLLLWAWLALRNLAPTETWSLLMKQTAGRAVDSFVHNRPIWWYLPLVPLLLLPWPLVLRWRRAANAAAQWRDSTAARFGLCAFIPAFVAFSVVSSKQIHYLLPLLPGAMLYLGALLRVDPKVISARRVVVLIVIVAAALAWSLWRPALAGAAAPRVNTTLYLISAVVIAVSLWQWRRMLHDPATKVVAITTLWITIAMLPLVRLQLVETMDLRALARRVATMQENGVPLARTANEPGLITFLGRLPEPLPATTDAVTWATSHPDGYVLAYAGHGHPTNSAGVTVRLSDGWVSLVPAKTILGSPAPGIHSP